jgi:nicotinate-nucleotide pyrophosphorylase (carboxylating)
VTHLLVDNQRPDVLAAWARRAGPGVTIQASGGVTVETARAYAEAGASLIAIGALTHSAPAAPIRCDISAGPTAGGGAPAVSTAPAPH